MLNYIVQRRLCKFNTIRFLVLRIASGTKPNISGPRKIDNLSTTNLIDLHINDNPAVECIRLRIRWIYFDNALWDYSLSNID